jgi:hypothetical protein
MPVDIRKDLKKFLPHLLKAQEEDLNEADTVQRLVKVFEEVLGYDAMTEITREKQVRDKFVDIAIKIDGAVRLLVEAKAGGTTLRDRHIEQAERYAAEANIRWVLLTNGVTWHLYHLSFEDGIDYDRVFVVDLSSDTIEKASELLGLLHRQAIRKGEHEEFWQHHAALSAESIGKALFTEEVLRFIRREIRKREKMLVDEEDLANAIHTMFSPEARERIGPVRIRRRKTVKAAKPREDAAAQPRPAPPAAPETGPREGTGGPEPN